MSPSCGVERVKLQNTDLHIKTKDTVSTVWIIITILLRMQEATALPKEFPSIIIMCWEENNSFFHGSFQNNLNLLKTEKKKQKCFSLQCIPFWKATRLFLLIRATCSWIWVCSTGETDRGKPMYWDKPTPLPLCLLQISHGLA